MNIHPSAILEPGAELGENVDVAAYAYIGENVRLGRNCSVGHGCYITGHVEAGENNIFYPYCAIGTAPQDLKYHGEGTPLTMGNDNVFREYVTVNRGTRTGRGLTSIGDRNIFMISSHLGHDCEVEDDVILINSVLVGGHCRLESGCKLMGGAAVNPFVSVGKLSFVGGLSRITKDVPPFMIVEGNPAKVRGVNEIGLARAGYEKEVVKKLDAAYRRIYRTKKLNRSEIFEELYNDSEVSDEAVYLVNFLRRSLKGRHGRYLESAQ